MLVQNLTPVLIPRPPGKNYKENRVILGTHTSESDQNYLMIAKVTTPVELEDAIENRKYDEYTQEAGGYGQNRAKVEIVQRINHDGEVNRCVRARACMCLLNLCYVYRALSGSPRREQLVMGRTKCSLRCPEQ
jgi:hypothetical protein